MAENEEPEDTDAGLPETAAQINELVRLTRAGHGDAEEIEGLPPTYEGLAVKDLEQDIGLKRTYAIGLLGLMGGQLVVADAVFIVYAWAGVHWRLSASVIDVWLGSTLVQVIAVVVVVTRYLFPRRDAQ